MKLSPNEIAWCAAQAGFAAADIPIAVAVAWAESRGDTDALGSVPVSGRVSDGNFDHGLWQISSYWHGAKLKANPDWRNPVVNAKLAKLVFDEAVKGGKVGWSPWATYNGTTPAYQQWMPYATLAAKTPFPPTLPVYAPKITVTAAPVDVTTLAAQLVKGIILPTVTLDPTTIPIRVEVTGAQVLPG